MQIETLIPDEKLAKEGKWIEYPEEEGVAFKIAYYGNDAYEVKLRKLAVAARRRGKVNLQQQTALEVESMLGTVLLDWRGLGKGYDEEGKEKPYPFSIENARELLMASKKVREFLSFEVTRLENFQPEPIEVEAEVIPGGSPELGDGASADLKSGTEMAA